MLIFVDKSGILSQRRYGYSLQGTRAVTEKHFVGGRRFSSIAAICIDGVIDVDITSESVNGDRFCHFIERCLQPQLLPFSGTNHRSVVVPEFTMLTVQ